MLGTCNVDSCKQEANHIHMVAEGFSGPLNWKEEYGIKRALAVCPKHHDILNTIEEQPEYKMCECEQDWNCPLHGGTNSPTWIESRYQGLDDEEERYYR